jgi:hypothetical protein
MTIDENSTRQVAETYFAAWQAKDMDRFRTILADDVAFAGPLAQLSGLEEVSTGSEGLWKITSAVDVQRMHVDGADVITWFDLHTTVAGPTPVANWTHVENGKITRIRVTFDPRGLLS